MLQKYKPTKMYPYLWRIHNSNQYMSVDEVGNEEADIVWRYSTCNVNSQLNSLKQITFSLKDETVFFVVVFFSFY